MLLLAVPLLHGTQASVIPKYTATQPDYQLPLAGLAPLGGAMHFKVFEATPATGTYNHQPMISRHGGVFHVNWKSAHFNEDQDGQRVLYSSSSDGHTWSEPVDVFPSMPASQFGCDIEPDGTEHCFDKIHHENTPFVTLNGRLYAVSNVRRHGSPNSVYPTPVQDLNTSLP